MGLPTSRAELIFDHDVSAESAGAVEDVFRELGFAPSARRRLTHRGPAELTWLMLASLPLQAFLTGLGGEVVKDLYAKAKKLAPGAKEGKSDPRPPLVLQDAKTELNVVLEADLPAEAIRALAGLDLAAYRNGPLHYDRHRKKWRSELDELGEAED
ncbi:hypothetical protein [Amycolatopsis sp. NPDC004079]|uniref:hypothetical protein n=1 Tax=Amycolatopsis sp. NPDC004079 TaxID=3154549 RepID=UPI0033BF6C70